MKIEEILLELQGIHGYMERKDAYYGLGQIGDLIKKLEDEQTNA